MDQLSETERPAPGWGQKKALGACLHWLPIAYLRVLDPWLADGLARSFFNPTRHPTWPSRCTLGQDEGSTGDRYPQGGGEALRIAHINNIANVAWRLAEAQRRLGHEAMVFDYQETPYRFPHDVSLPGAEGPLGWNSIMFANWRRFADFDVLHVHGGIWKSQLFYPLFKRRFRWKTLAVHFHGTETRTGKGLHHLGSADVQFHSTPDLRSFLPGSLWIPNPIDLPPKPEDPNNPVPRFGHFVSSEIAKGTERVLDLFHRAFGPLETETRDWLSIFRGKHAELWVVTRAPHEEALRIMTGCGAVIDQISTYGIYGVVGIEAMASGKPVFGTPREDWYPSCPVIPLSSGGEERLVAIARDERLRREVGERGREYVAEVHESGNVARRVLKAYYVAQQEPPLRADRVRAYWLRRGATYSREFASRRVQRRSEAQSEELLQILGRVRFDSVAEIGCGFGRIGAEVIK